MQKNSKYLKYIIDIRGGDVYQWKRVKSMNNIWENVTLLLSKEQFLNNLQVLKVNKSSFF